MDGCRYWDGVACHGWEGSVWGEQCQWWWLRNGPSMAACLLEVVAATLLFVFLLVYSGLVSLPLLGHLWLLHALLVAARWAGVWVVLVTMGMCCGCSSGIVPKSQRLPFC